MMDPEDVGKVLAVAAMYDRRTVGKTDILAWGSSLDGLDPRDCAEAIRAHYTDPDTCSAYLLPGHVRGRIRQIRRDRIKRERDETTMRALEAAKDEWDPTAAHFGYLEATRMLQARLAEIHPERDEPAPDADAVAPAHIVSTRPL